jgi:hypothetical protein
METPRPPGRELNLHRLFPGGHQSRGSSSAGRAPHLHCGGQGFESPPLHVVKSQNPKTIGNLEYYYRVRAAKIAQLGGRCVDCGSEDELQFDHQDSATKDFTISPRITNKSESVDPELEKCVLRCKTCHTAKSRANGDFSNRGGLVTCPSCDLTCNKGGMAVHQRAKQHYGV